MGQYHKVVNLDKKEFLNPHKLGAGLKLGEFNEGLVMIALSILLADNNGSGGGDIFTPKREAAQHSGRWAGDRITITGDYTENGRYKEEREGDNLYDSLNEREADDNGMVVKTEFKDISGLMRESLADTDWYAEQIAAAKEW